MFEGSLVESTALLDNRNRWPAVVSITVQVLALGGLLAVPVLHPEVLPLRRTTLSFVPPAPKPPTPPPQPPQHVRLQTTDIAALAPRMAPPTLGPRIPHDPVISDGPVGPPATNVFSMGGDGPSMPFGPDSGGGGTATRVVRAADPGPGKPARISSGIISGLLLEPIKPIYPTIAKTTGAQGTVVIAAIISKTGRIESAHVQSGPPLLQGAALDAVRVARYRPYLLNGEPTEVETTISINFHIGN